MNKLNILIFLTLILSCKPTIETPEMIFSEDKIPDTIPLVFKENLTPKDKLIHKGIFSPDLKEYYYTLSDKDFTHFNIYVIRKRTDGWTTPEKAFFNSSANDHGMSFSPDGNSIYFSSTRPTGEEGIPETWHIWKTDNIDGQWTEPVYQRIPNLTDKLVSHPSISDSGTVFFHSSNLDYSEMNIYYSKAKNGKLGAAEKLDLPTLNSVGTCTPYISPNEDYLIFATIGEQLDLMVCFKGASKNWTTPKKLHDKINNFGQGNPYITPDNRFLFFTTNNIKDQKWNVKWVHIESEIKRQ